MPKLTEAQTIAAKWWETSNSPMGATYAAMIRANGEGYPLARGQLAAIVAKGERKGRLTLRTGGDEAPATGQAPADRRAVAKQQHSANRQHPPKS